LKECGTKWSWPNMGYYSSICLEVLSRQQYPRQDFKSLPPQ